jgi:hypothetical protein
MAFRGTDGYSDEDMIQIKNMVASDNGNRFLCETCKHSRKRSGKMHEIVIRCLHPEMHGRVSFVVTQCDGYASAELYEKAAQLKRMITEAHYVHLSNDTGRHELIPAARAAQMDLEREVYQALHRKFNIDLTKV